MKVSSETKLVVTIEVDQKEACVLARIADNTDWGRCPLASQLWDALTDIDGVEEADEKDAPNVRGDDEDSK